MKLRLDTLVTAIDVAGRRLRVREPNGEHSFLEYDELVVGTGVLPVRLPVAGLDDPGAADGVHLPHALATGKSALEQTVPEVLFICVQNSGRSQMAAALLKDRAGDRVHVRSAGSAPAEQIDPHAIGVMRRRGVSLDEEFPKPLTDDVVRAADVVVTMGCGDSCPLYAGKRYLDWAVTDPAGQTLDATESIALDIEARVDALLDELIGAPQ